MALMMGGVLIASAPAEALQCVPFAREMSGISIRGDAWTWWGTAAGQYERGHAPKVGAVVVFKKYAGMRHGHVAVVARVVNSREVMVDHANWAPHKGRGRGQVSKMVRVTDVSANNDWTEVRVWNASTSDYGTRNYPTYGFIYPQSSRGYVQQAAATIVSDEDTAAVIRRRSPVPDDSVLATADRQIAAALAGDCLPAASAAAPAPAAQAEAPAAAAKTPDVKVPDVKIIEVRTVESKVIEGRMPEAKAAAGVRQAETRTQEAAPEVKAPEIKVPDAKVPETKTIEAAIPLSVEPKVAVIASNDVRSVGASVQTASLSAGAGNDGIWEGDAAAAKRFGAGRY